MKAIFLVALLVIQSLTASTQYEQVFTQIRQVVQLKYQQINSKNGFSKEISGLLELKMMQGSKVEEVLQIISDLIKQMQSDQNMEDSEYAQREAQLNVDIELLEYTVGSLSAQLKSANTQIIDVSTEISSLMTTQLSLAKQLTVLNGKEEEVREINQLDSQASTTREINNSRIIDALNQIIQLLSEAVMSEQNKSSVFTEFQRNQLSKKLKESLGVNNPIAILVSVTTKFDIPTVTRIIQKIENLRDATMRSQVTDNESKIESDVTFQTLIQQIVDVRERMAFDLSTNKGLVSRRTNEKIIAQRTQTQINADLPVTQDLLINTRNQGEVLENSHQSRKQSRGEELNIVQQAFTIVSQQSDRIKANS